MAALICGTCGNRFASYVGACPACGQPASGARPAEPEQTGSPTRTPPPPADPSPSPPTQTPPPQAPPPQAPPPQAPSPQTPSPQAPSPQAPPPTPPQQPATAYAGPPAWSAPSAPSQPPVPSVPAGAPAPKGRKALWAALAGVVGLVVVGGGIAAFVLTNDDDPGEKKASDPSSESTEPGEPGDTETALAAVDSEPSQAWEWDPGAKPVDYVSASDDLVVASKSDGLGLVGLDPESGDELWTEDSHQYSYAYLYPEAERVVANYDDDSNYSAAVLDFDGNVVWDAGEDYESVVTVEDDGTLLASNGDNIDRIDPDQDEPLWDIDYGSDYWLGPDTIITVDRTRVVSYDRESGEEQWRTDLPEGHDADLDEDYHIQVAANDDFVLASTGSLTALSLDGEELWTEEKGGALAEAADGRFLVTPYDGVGGGGEFAIYGVDGEVGTVDISGVTDDYVSLSRPEVDGEEMNFLYNGGILFDADGGDVDDGYDDAYWVVDGGYYIAEGKTLGYREWGSDEPAWSVELADITPIEDEYDVYDADFKMAASDEAVYVYDRDKLWRYE